MRLTAGLASAALAAASLALLAPAGPHPSAGASAAPTTFLETFDGSPGAPQPFRPADWDITINDSGRAVDRKYAMNSMMAGHGPDCSPPGERGEHTHGPLTSWSQAIFLCKDHVMTAVHSGGYAALWLTPPAQLDFSQGEAVLRWDMSTFRTSARDWVDVVVAPWEDDLQTMNDGHSPLPARGVLLEMRNSVGNTDFNVRVLRPAAEGGEVNLADPFGPVYDKVLTVSATRRDTFELRLSRTHLKFGMPAYNLWFADKDIPGPPLSWGQGLVHLGHYSYTPSKDHNPLCPGGVDGCGPDTWHWDNVSLAPAAPVTILRADQEYAEGPQPAALTFPAPAPAGAALRFVGYGLGLQVSTDGGATWADPGVKPGSVPPSGSLDTPTAYWQPVPPGTQQVLVRSTTPTNGWFVHDPALFSQRPSPPPAPAAPAPPAAPDSGGPVPAAPEDGAE
jgi:hypothetical protein